MKRHFSRGALNINETQDFSSIVFNSKNLRIRFHSLENDFTVVYLFNGIP